MADRAGETKTVKVTFEFTVSTDIEPEVLADSVFDLLCAQDEMAYESCDGWDLR